MAHRTSLAGAVALGCTVTLAAACSVGSAQPTSAALPRSSVAISGAPAGSPRTGPRLGILVDLNATGPAGSVYDVALVGLDGKVAARARAARRGTVHTPGSGPGAAALELPQVSASDTHVYYLDGDSTVRFLAPDGSTGVAAHVMGTPTAHAAFSVSPDDKRLAVSVLDYSGSPVRERLYVRQLAGGSQAELFSSTSQYVWPVGWRGDQLVLAALSQPPYSQQGVSWNPYDAPSYHLVDPATGNRTASLGSGEQQVGGCQPTGPLSAAGSACFSVQGSTGCLDLLGWSGRSTPTGVCAPSQDVGVGSLDPTGSRIARCCDASHHVLVWRRGATVQATSLSGFPSDWDCWLDAQHLLSGAALDAQPKPALINLATGATVAVAAKGFCGGVLPGDLSS
jgi:hypothetical protein